MNKIAITGKIGSGKSTALSYFKRAGHFTLSSDAIIKEIYSNSSTRELLLKRLGIKSKDYKGEIINKIKDPSFNYELKKNIYPIMNRLRFSKTPSFVTKKSLIFEIPLLFEEKLEKNYDKIIFIKCDYTTRLNRILKKGMTKEYFKTMNKYQGPDGPKENYSDITIYNNTSKINFYESLCRHEKTL